MGKWRRFVTALCYRYENNFWKTSRIINLIPISERNYLLSRTSNHTNVVGLCCGGPALIMCIIKPVAPLRANHVSDCFGSKATRLCERGVWPRRPASSVFFSAGGSTWPLTPAESSNIHHDMLGNTVNYLLPLSGPAGDCGACLSPGRQSFLLPCMTKTLGHNKVICRSRRWKMSLFHHWVLCQVRCFILPLSVLSCCCHLTC